MIALGIREQREATQCRAGAGVCGLALLVFTGIIKGQVEVPEY